MRFNDGRCDRQGRFWAGTMLMDMAAGSRVGRALPLRATDSRGRPPLQLDDLIVPNGLAFSPDGRTMYLSDSHPSVQTDLGLRLRHGHRHAARTAACSST